MGFDGQLDVLYLGSTDFLLGHVLQQLETYRENARNMLGIQFRWLEATIPILSGKTSTLKARESSLRLEPLIGPVNTTTIFPLPLAQSWVKNWNGAEGHR